MGASEKVPKEVTCTSHRKANHDALCQGAVCTKDYEQKVDQQSHWNILQQISMNAMHSILVVVFVSGFGLLALVPSVGVLGILGERIVLCCIGHCHEGT